MIARLFAGAVLLGTALAVSATAANAQRNGAAPSAVTQGAPSAALARELLAEMVRARTLDTGNTTPLVESLAQRFRAAGFPAADVLVVGAGARNRNLLCACAAATVHPSRFSSSRTSTS